MCVLNVHYLKYKCLTCGDGGGTNVNPWRILMRSISLLLFEGLGCLEESIQCGAETEKQKLRGTPPRALAKYNISYRVSNETKSTARKKMTSTQANREIPAKNDWLEEFVYLH